MTQQLAFARFDVASLAGQPRQYLVAFFFVVVVAVASPIPVLAVPAAAAMVSLLTATTFAHDERGRLDTLYATLPTSRRTVVVGRYLTTLTLWAVLSAVAVAAVVAVPLVRGRPLQLELLPVMLVISFVVVALAVSVQIPFFFAVGHTRARPVSYLPVLLVAGAAYLAGRFDLLPDAAPTQGVLPLALAAVLVALAVLAVSGGVASRLYRKRQL